MKTIYLYRALAEGEDKLICNTYSSGSNLISEAYSRVLSSSLLNPAPSLRCFSEDPRIALEYSKKLDQGYSGKIVKIEAKISEEGDARIEGIEGKVEAYRLWRIEDWLHLAALSELSALPGEPLTVINLNCSVETKLSNVITYGGQSSARAYCLRSMAWVIHQEEEMSYDKISHILSEDEKRDIEKMKRYFFPSNKVIKYKDPQIEKICKSLLEEFQEFLLANKKSWVKNTIDELKKIKASIA